jgi:hypothetical protein
MRRGLIYAIFIVLTMCAMLGVRMFCFEFDYYIEIPLLLTVIGMNALLGIVIFESRFAARILIAALVALLALGSSYALLILLALTGVQVPLALVLFAVNIGFWELAIEIWKRRRSQ